MKRGGKLESLILQAGERLAALQIARLWKWPERVVIRPTKIACPHCSNLVSSVESLHVERTGFDFCGFDRNGRFLAIEAKECQKQNLPVNVWKGHGVKVHQVDALMEVIRAGGWACVLWMQGKEVRLFYPEAMLGKKSLRWLEGIEFSRPGVWLEWFLKHPSPPAQPLAAHDVDARQQTLAPQP